MEQAVSAPVNFEGTEREASGERRGKTRFAASVMFLVDGVGFGTWAALLPTFREKFGLDEKQLSHALLGMVIGALIGMPVVGRCISKWGSRRVLRFLAPAFSLFLSVLAFAPTFQALIGAAVIFGAMKGAFDVSVNSQAIAVENAVKRPIMSTFQALWSIGGMLAALIVGLALRNEIAPLTVALVMSAVLFLLAIGHSGGLLGGDASAPKHEKTSSWPSPTLIRIGALAFLVLFAEGVMMDWSAVYTRTVAGAAEWLAPFAFGVFSIAMATGRLVGDRVLAKVGPHAVLRYGGVLTALGVLIVILVPVWPATFAGLALAGLGLSNQVTVLFGAGGRAHAAGVAEGVAAVSMMGYAGFLTGPPAIGGIGHVIGLPASFALVVAFMAVLALWGPRTLGQAAK